MVPSLHPVFPGSWSADPLPARCHTRASASLGLHPCHQPHPPPGSLPGACSAHVELDSWSGHLACPAGGPHVGVPPTVCVVQHLRWTLESCSSTGCDHKGLVSTRAQPAALPPSRTVARVCRDPLGHRACRGPHCSVLNSSPSWRGTNCWCPQERWFEGVTQEACCADQANGAWGRRLGAGTGRDAGTPQSCFGNAVPSGLFPRRRLSFLTPASSTQEA